MEIVFWHVGACDTENYMLVWTRVGILVCLRVIDPLFFLWTHMFQLKLTISRPLWTSMYSQWSKNIPWKIIDNVPFFVHPDHHIIKT